MFGTDLEPDAEDPAFELLSRAVRDAFRDLTAGRFSQTELSEGLGSAPNRLSRFLSGKRGMTVDESLRLLGLTRTDPVLFLQLVAARLPPPSPAATVEQLCLSPDAEPEPFLVEIRALLSETREPVASRGSRIPEIEELDNLRFAGAPAARDQLELVCRDLAIEAAASLETERSLRELVRALGLWATICRTLGDKSSAAQAYVLAFRLAASARDLEGTAHLRKRASYLLVDAGHFHFALQFLNNASEYFLLTRNEEQFARCLVDRGVLLMKANLEDQAEQVFLQALESLSSPLYRTAANQWLSIHAEHKQNISEARRRLDLALEAACDRRDRIIGHLAWQAARLAIQVHEDAAAATHLQRAIQSLSATGNPFDGELALIDLAELSQRRGHVDALRECGREILARLSKNSHSRIATAALIKLGTTAALIKLGNCLLWGSPTSDDLAQARQKLELAAKVVPPPPLTFT